MRRIITTEKIMDNYNSYRIANKKKWSPMTMVNGRLECIWNAGANFRNISKHPGAYSQSEWERMGAMFPEEQRGEYMHLFSGGIPAGNYYRVDEKGFPDAESGMDFKIRFPDLLHEQRFSKKFLEFGPQLDLIFADPYWTDDHARKTYKTEPIDKRWAMRVCNEILVSGGILLWKDANSPHRSNDMWEYIGFFPVDPSSGHMDRSFRMYRKR